MLLEYLIENYLTLMLLLALSVIILVNRKSAAVPASRYFGAAIVLLLVVTVLSTVDSHISSLSFFGLARQSAEALRRTRIAVSAAIYILLPLIVMIEVLITAPNQTFRWISLAPAVLNTAVYLTAFFGSGLAFTVTLEYRWYRGPLGLSIYFTLLFYVFLLSLFSIIYFRWDNARRSAIVFLIVIQSIFAAILEYTDTLSGTVPAFMALGMLEYYFYLSVIYQQEMREMMAEKELHIARQQMSLLRSQIQPHFIFNSLSVIRALAKRDSKKAVSCIDSFSDYLKAHIYSIQENELIPFEKELEHIQAYLDLVQADTMRNVEVVYDLSCTDFLLPPLSLEPIVENAIKHGIGGKGGTIRISSERKGDAVILQISDNGTPQGGMTEQETARLGVGLDNTKKRLAMQCRGTLHMDLTDAGAVVTITLPQTKEGV
ncbi:MAG: histidine kinase [Lachnospiraceae bacterium]|nr:histidine kinase [Lachnospiraceae bacterium]